MRAIDAILACTGIKTPMFCEQDELYIKLMSLLLVDREVIMKLYYNISPYKITVIMRNPNLDLNNFNPLLLGITVEEYADFLASLAKI